MAGWVPESPADKRVPESGVKATIDVETAKRRPHATDVINGTSHQLLGFVTEDAEPAGGRCERTDYERASTGEHMSSTDTARMLRRVVSLHRHSASTFCLYGAVGESLGGVPTMATAR